MDNNKTCEENLLSTYDEIGKENIDYELNQQIQSKENELLVNAVKEALNCDRSQQNKNISRDSENDNSIHLLSTNGRKRNDSKIGKINNINQINDKNNGKDCTFSQYLITI